MRAGKNIIFLDAREPEEFAEFHLPNAINVPLRNVNQAIIKHLQNADYVIPYCRKDFRGFEVAKTLKQLGLDNVALLYPSGLNGWLSRWPNTSSVTVIRPNSRQSSILN